MRNNVKKLLKALLETFIVTYRKVIPSAKVVTLILKPSLTVLFQVMIYQENKLYLQMLVKISREFEQICRKMASLVFNNRFSFNYSAFSDYFFNNI